MRNYTVSGRMAVLLWALYPNKKRAAPELWELLRVREPDGQPELFTMLSCGAVYAGIRTLLYGGWIEEAGLNAEGVRLYHLSDSGRTLALSSAERLHKHLEGVLSAPFAGVGMA